MSKIILIGIGNEFRQDDGVGLAIATQLQSKLPTTIDILQASGEGAGPYRVTTGLNSLFHKG